MRPKRDAIPRAKEAWWWLGGMLSLGLVGAGVVAAGVALWENIDIRQLTPGLTGAPAPLPVAMVPSASVPAQLPFRAVLFESSRSRAYFEDPTFYDAQLVGWQEIVAATGGAVRRVSDAEALRTVAVDEVIVMPETPCLASAELAALGAHLSRGGSLVTNWALGVRDGACEWRGWQLLKDITGAEDLRELPPRQGLYLTVPAGLPTSPGIDPGSRIEMRPDPSIALRMPGQKVYWSDWALNPAPDEDGAGADVAVSTTRTPEGGRVTWFGVRNGQAATPEDSLKLDRLLANGVRWAAGAPHAAPAPWPGAARAALVFALDVEGIDAYVNVLDAAAMFQVEELPITFFVVSQLVRDNQRVADALIAAGEVGSQTVDHTPLAGLTRQEQTLRLRRSWDDIEDWTGVGPAGLRPPEEVFDRTTLEAWASVGGRYLLSTNEARSASPEIHETQNGAIVVLPRILKDDYSVIVRDVTLRSQRLAEAFIAGTRKMRAIGGLAVIAGHTQIIVSGPRLEAVRTVANTVRAEGDWWIAQADEVAEWWLARSLIDVRWADRVQQSGFGFGAGGLPDLLVSIGGEAAVDDVWVDVVLPALEEGTLPVVDGVSVDFASEMWGMRVRVGTLRPDEVRRISFVTVETQ